MELDKVDGVEGKLKVWIRRVWTLEMVRLVPLIDHPFAAMLNILQSVIGLR